jgi:hypothetical protein
MGDIHTTRGGGWLDSKGKKMSKMKHQVENYKENLNQHQLATPSLRKLLRTIGQPTTPEEKRIMASIARAYERMGNTFPTKELSKILDALYSHVVSLTDRVRGALSALVVDYSLLAVTAKELSFAHITPKPGEATSLAWAGAVDAVDLEVMTPALIRCYEVLYLALASASNQIDTALKAAKKKR